METWIDVSGYEGYYRVSNLGRVERLAREIKSYGGRKYLREGCLLKPYPVGGGRSQNRLEVELYREGRSRRFKVAELVLSHFDRPRPAGLEVRHLNDDWRDNSLDNLAWGTHSENMRDRVRNGGDRNAQKTECPRKHRLEGNNLRPAGLRNGKRQCLACHQARNTVYRTGTGNLQELSDRNYARIMDGVLLARRRGR